MSMIIDPYRFAPVSSWTPANLAVPPKAWVNDSSPVTDVSGACSQWNDISGNANHFSQVTAGNRPLLMASGLSGRRTVRFDGVNDHLDNAVGLKALFQNVATGWAMVLYKKTALDGAGTDRMIFNNVRGTDGGTRFAMYASYAAGNNVPKLMCRRLDADAGSNLDSAAAPGTNWTMMLMTMDWANGDGTIYANGAQTNQNLALTSSGTTSNTASSQACTIGAQYTNSLAADIEVAELMVGSGASLPTPTEIDKLFGYAAHRWGLTGSLPGGHAYKTTPPSV